VSKTPKHLHIIIFFQRKYLQNALKTCSTTYIRCNMRGWSEQRAKHRLSHPLQEDETINLAFGHPKPCLVPIFSKNTTPHD